MSRKNYYQLRFVSDIDRKSIGQITPIEMYKTGGSIYIKPENRGKFTALKERTGHSATWFKENGTPAQRKMATFALNARHWNHRNKYVKGGPTTKNGIPLNYFPLEKSRLETSKELNYYPNEDLNPIAYLKDYVNSPSFRSKAPSKEYIETAKKNIKTFKKVITPENDKGFKSFIRRHTPYGYYPSAEKDNEYIYMPSEKEKTFNTKFPSDYSKKHNVNINYILAHEFGHIIDPMKSVKLYPKVDDDAIYYYSDAPIEYKRLLDNTKIPSSKINNHDISDPEKYADLQALRYMLYKNKIYDARTTKKFTQDDLNKARKLLNSQSRTLDMYDDNTVIDMMNTIAENNNVDFNNERPQAAFGLSLEGDDKKFGAAFAKAKSAGKKTFTWNGKEYTTETADDKSKASTTQPLNIKNAPILVRTSDGGIKTIRQTPTTSTTTSPKPKTNPFYNNHGYTQYNWSKDLADMVYDTIQKDTAYIHFKPIDIAHVIGDESSFDRYARGTYITTDAKGNKVTKLKSFVGPFQQDKARFQIINPTKGASRWQEYADKKREDQYITNDIVDYLRSQDKRITSERDKMTYGRLKINQYAPNSRLDDKVSESVWKNNIVHEIKLGRLSNKLKLGTATYRDLMNSYDELNSWK